jgi:GT2 family glycosyltransferase
VVEARRGAFQELRVVRTSRRGLNRARNLGARSARGELLAFCDADDVVSPGWLAALVAAAREADLVGGTLDLETLNPPSVRAWRPGVPLAALPVAHEFLPYVPGGNCAIWADVARALGWDESFRFGSSDVEYGWRAHLAGYRLGFAPDAVIAQRFRSRLAPTLLQHVRYGASVPHLYRRFGPLGMRSPGPAGALQTWRRIARTTPDLLRSPERRGHWLRFTAVSVGRLGGSVRWRAFHP